MNLIRILATAAIALSVLNPVTSTADEPVPPTLILPVPDAERGRAAFGAKGCVVCHKVNGIGGNAGPALGGGAADNEIDPLDFAAAMWRGARAMSALQAMQFGYQIELSGPDIADLAAFLANEDEVARFTEKDIPEAFRGWTINVALDGPANGAGSADADEASAAARGYILAERWCAGCHAVLRTGDYGAAGPAFAEIAGKTATTPDSIRKWLSEPHKKMPEIIGLSDTDIEDVATYILSMRR